MDDTENTVMTPLELDTACCNQANWRTDLPLGLDAGGFEARMVAAGWASRSHHPALRVFRHGGGHEVAWVVTTGRVQIRVDLEVPRDARRRQAEALYEELGDCLISATAGRIAGTEIGEGSTVTTGCRPRTRK